MSKSTSFENGLMLLVFNNTNLANIGDATGLRGSTTAGSLYLALHTADPGQGGSQTTNECNYTSYARVAIARSGAGFVVTASSVSPAANQDFPQCTGAADNQQATHWSVGVASSGAGMILHSGVIAPSAPKILTGAVSDAITIPGHGLAVNDRVIFEDILGLALPTGITRGTAYYVKTAPDADTITISTTQGGTTLDITASGAGIAFKATPITITLNVIPRLTSGSTVTED